MNLSSRDELAGSTEEASMHSLDFLKKPPIGLRWWRQALRRATVVALCVAAASSSYAADVTAPDGASEGVVRVKLTQARVVVEAGKEKLVEAEVLKPGERRALRWPPGLLFGSEATSARKMALRRCENDEPRQRESV